jgi:hypothetical protein
MQKSTPMKIIIGVPEDCLFLCIKKIALSAIFFGGE